MKRRKWLALLLSVCMLGQTASAVWAEEPETAATEVTAESISAEEEPEEILIPVGDTAEENVTQESEEVVIESVPEVQEETEVPMTGEEASEPTVECTDSGDGYLTLKLLNYVKPDSVGKIQFAVWSKNNGQDDLKWYDAKDLEYKVDLAAHNDDLGDYYIHVYEAGPGMNCICRYTFNVASIVRKGPQLEVKDEAGDEKKFSLELKNFKKSKDTEEVTCAIWSIQDGQDDLKWYPMTQNADGNYAMTFLPENHKTAGEYQLHVYEKNNGKMVFQCKSSINISKPTAESVEVEKINQTDGTCTIIVKGVDCPSGVTRVELPTWSKKDQSDIYWYQAKKQSDGTWKAEMKISNHKGNIGTYQIHAYAHCGNGFRSKVAATTVTYEAGEAVVTAEAKNGTYLLKTKGIAIPGDIQQIEYAVWSKENKQKDLKWFVTTYDSVTRTAEYNLNMKGYTTYGEYIVHCYAKLTDGTMVYLGPTGFTVEKPTLDGVDITTDSSTGTFEIHVKGLTGAITDVVIPVWSSSDQSDLVWYSAKKDSSGDYVVKSNISKHNYNSENYKAHVYVTDITNIQSCIARETFSFEMKKGEVQIIESKANTTYKAMISGVSVAGLKSIEFAVWSSQGGQDDLKWYQATKNGDNYVSTISIKDHKTNGEYNVHCYANDSKGNKIFLGKNTFTVTSSVSASVSCADATTAGGFKVTVKINSASSPVSKVTVPVWSTANGQDDLKWYTATKQSDGTYTVNVDLGNHNLQVGTYAVHVYVALENGISINAAQTSYNFNVSNLLVVQKTGNGTRKVTLVNPSASYSKVTFPTWSDDKGQDDIKWYGGTRQSNGNWTATIKSANHKSAGTYQVHCYADDSFVGNTTFTFEKSEMAKNGWYYENGYKFYYKNDVKQTNVSSIIGPQGSYVAKINRITCTVTIYANDPDSNKGYIVPVIAFTCSVGLPGTPTTAGTHYTFAKYRWKELMGPSWGQYATKFTGDGIYFHSVAGVNTTSYNLNSIDYNNLGIPASHGCVRLCVRDAKWIYDNCPLGMKVIVYDSSDPGPFGKPATIKIPAGQTWDPTDPNV